MYANLQKKKIKKGVVSSGFTNISRSHNSQALFGYATKKAATIATNQGFFLIKDISLSKVPIFIINMSLQRNKKNINYKTLTYFKTKIIR
jgi:hypothetical protein